MYTDSVLARISIFLLILSIPLHAAEIKVAAASDLNFALRELVTAFERQSGHKVVLSFGSSGNFYSQIQNGAPFDVFMSADADYPAKLVQAGFGDAGSLYSYARGFIVLWVPASSPLDPQKLQGRLLLDQSVQKIAIANPKHAPYGRAAEAALKSMGLYSQVSTKLVVGENIGQAAQFVETGNAQAGIIALSLALAPPMQGRGKFWQLPESDYPPLNQAALVLKSSRQQDAARAFLEFLKTPTARAIFQRYGFREANTTR